MEIIIKIIRQDIYLTLVTVFLLGAAADFIWCKWMKNVADKKPFAAANWSLMIGLMGLISTLMIIAGEWIPLIAFQLGYYTGTYFAVWNSKRNSEKCLERCND